MEEPTQKFKEPSLLALNNIETVDFFLRFFLFKRKVRKGSFLLLTAFKFAKA